MAAHLQPTKDPIAEEISAAKLKTRQAYNNRRFDALEAEAAQLRAGKAIYGNGGWKILKFYGALGCREEEPESMWQLHERIHQEWIAAQPRSITARIAYADFLTEYAWHARGSGYANTVTKEGWKLFRERLEAARQVLIASRSLEEKGSLLVVANLGRGARAGLSAAQFQAVLNEGHAFEPRFWAYDTSRAYSLLPRWHGQPGDWEAYAAEAAVRPGGLGMEIYARIIIELRGFYKDVFRETKASWPKTREGLVVLLQKYPESFAILSESTVLASMAQDRAMAQGLFERIGNRYFSEVWESPEQFLQCRHWAETGQW